MAIIILISLMVIICMIPIILFSIIYIGAKSGDEMDRIFNEKGIWDQNLENVDTQYYHGVYNDEYDDLIKNIHNE